MGTWAIGDVQGCREPLERLLAAIARREAGEPAHLWFVGDLVNRGPDSAGVLRFVRELGERATVVLGNHDIYLLARALGAADRSALHARDGLDDVLEAPDSDELIHWLRHRPLAAHAPELSGLMVHAGLHPSWTAEEAISEARAVEALLQGPDGHARSFLAGSFSGTPPAWTPALRTPHREVAALALFTRARCLHTDRRLALGFHGPLTDLPATAPITPWWRLPHARDPDLLVVVGHWAALGLHREPGLLALDTGCVWGRELTAARLEDGVLVSVPATPGAG